MRAAFELVLLLCPPPEPIVSASLLLTSHAHPCLRRAKAAAAVASVAIDAMRKLSGANLSSVSKVSYNDVAVDVMRKLSGTNLNEAVIEAARKRSGLQLKLTSERIEANRSKSGASLRSISTPGAAVLDSSKGRNAI